MKWKRWNDQFALIIMAVIVILWLCDPFFRYFMKVGLPEAIIGATVAIFTLIAQFYFRRKEPEPNGENGGQK